MAFQVSPGVQVQEVDLTNVVPAVSTTIGGFAGAFDWGPVHSLRQVGSEKELESLFFKPRSADTSKYFLPAAGFLMYANALKVVRMETDGMLNATAAGNGELIQNEQVYEDATWTADGAWAAKYPGTLGNSIEISVCPADATIFNGWDYKSSFDRAPSTSDFASERGGENDEFHIAIIDENGAITGVPEQVLEIYPNVSMASDSKKVDGTSNYYKDVINSQSRWVWWTGHVPTYTRAGNTVQSVVADETASGDFLQGISAAVSTIHLSGGTDDNAPTTGEATAAYDLFGDAETLDVNLLFAYPDANGENTIAEHLISIADTRKDCVVFLSPPIEDSTSSTPSTDVIAWADSITSSSYAFMDSSAIRCYDKYRDTFMFVPAAGHIAGMCANTDNVADPWFSPAGLNRGQILGASKLAYNPAKADRDELYKARVNPLVTFPGEGTVLFGDRTALAKPSPFDRLNVRRLFITLEKAISTAARFQLFEFNDEFTRAQFRNLVEPFLRDVKGRRGITDFAVVCDGTNNPGEIVDTNQFVADIYVKPARAINFVNLNFIVTRSGVEFSEIVGQ